MMIPGPIDPPDEVLKRCGMPVIPHYEGGFPAFYQQLTNKMKYIFGTKDGIVHVANGSGTMAVSMMLASFCTPDDSVLVINNGSFGGYGENNFKNLGIPYVSVKGKPGTVVNYDKVYDKMKRNRHQFIYVTHNESSTAMVNPLLPLGKIAREFDALLLVDSISAVGGMLIEMDKCGADVVAGASQKCLELPPGLAPIAVSSRAQEYLKNMKNRKVPYVLDLEIWRKALEIRGDWHPQPITGATTMLYALDWMVDEIKAEGLENRQERFRQTGEYLKKAFYALGFKLAADPEYASPVVTEFIVPEGYIAEDFRSFYMNKHNLMVGRGERMNSEGQINSFRVAHFGRATEKQRVDMLIDITREYLKKH
jgi:alanine-glyoxylate transaminase / serine-glyoxylate transaminase / serine-pyruvate transaminase